MSESEPRLAGRDWYRCSRDAAGSARCTDPWLPGTDHRVTFGLHYRGLASLPRNTAVTFGLAYDEPEYLRRGQPRWHSALTLAAGMCTLSPHRPHRPKLLHTRYVRWECRGDRTMPFSLVDPTEWGPTESSECILFVLIGEGFARETDPIALAPKIKNTQSQILGVFRWIEICNEIRLVTITRRSVHGV